MAISTQSKFILGAAGVGAYTGDITEDPMGGLMSAGIFGMTATMMKLSTSDIRGAGNVVQGLKVDQAEILRRRLVGYTEQELRTLNSVKSKVASWENGLTNVPKLEAKLQEITDKLSVGPLSQKQSKRLYKLHGNISNKLFNVSQAGMDARAAELANQLKQFGVNIKGDYEGLKTYAQAITDPKIASQLQGLLSGSNVISPVTAANNLRLPSNKTALFKLAETDVNKQLSEYFQKNFNTSAEVADRKAQLILERSVGDILTVKGQNAHFTDAISGKSVSLPLTAETQRGVLHYSPKPGTHYAVTGVNPYGSAFNRGEAVPIFGTGEVRVPTLADVRKGIHPELLALELYQGKDIKAGIEFAKSKLKYGGDETAVETTMNGVLKDSDLTRRFISNGTAISYEHVINSDVLGNIDEKNPLRTLSTVSTQGGASAEHKAVLFNIANKLIEEDPTKAGGIWSGISTNSLTTLSTNSSTVPLNAMSMNERGSSTVGIRDTITKAANRTDAFNQLMAVKNPVGFENQYESANVFNKLDIQDKQAYNNLIAKVLGNDTVLADGAGLFNLESSRLFEHYQNQKMTISKQATGHIFLNDKMLNDVFTQYTTLADSGSSAINTKNGIDRFYLDLYKKVNAYKDYNNSLINSGKEQLFDANLSFSDIADLVNTSEFKAAESKAKVFEKELTIRSGTNLGTDSLGSQVSLHKQFTDAVLTGMNRSEQGDLVIHAAARFNPSAEKIVKIFSESAKSNLTGIEDYKVASTLGALLNLGGNHISGDKIKLGRKSYELNKENLQKIYNEIEDKFNNKQRLTSPELSILRAGRSSIILAAEDTHTKEFAAIAKAKSVQELKQLLIGGGKISFSAESIASIERLATQVGKGTTRDYKRATLAHMMNTNVKSGTDISATVIGDIFNNFDRVVHRGSGSQSQQIAVKNMLTSFGMNAKDVLQGDQLTRDKAKSKLIDALNSKGRLEQLSGSGSEEAFNTLFNLTKGLSDENFESYASGLNKTIGSMNKGQAVLGTGNNAKLSWTAFEQLRRSGLSREELSYFGKTDFKSHVELQSLISERSNYGKYAEKHAINKQIAGNEYDVERILSKNIPENRVAELAKIGVNVSDESSFITYELKNRFKDLERLNFATVSTDRSGFYDDGTKRLKKRLESKKIELFHLDHHLYTAKGTERIKAKEAFETVASEYKILSESMLRGKNSLLKEVASLVTDKSNISLVKAIGGSASDYIQDAFISKGKMPNAVFISEEGLQLRMKRMGLKSSDIVGTDIGNGLQTVKYKAADGSFLDLKSLVTREPAQGPLSSSFEHLVVDTSIKGKDTAAHMYITENHFGYINGKYGDYDQDQVQELFPRLKSQAQFDALDTKFTNVGNELNDMVRLHSNLKVKGSSKETLTPVDFKTSDEAIHYKNVAGLKGRERKALAAASTAIATDLTSALSEEFGDTSGRAVRGRFMAHTLVENLLKSAHIDTKKFEEHPEADVEALSRLRKAYVGNKIDAKSYREQITPIFERSLNMDKVKVSTDVADADKKILTDTFNDVIDAEVKQARHVSSVAKNPLNVTQGVGKGSGIIDRTVDAISNFTDTEASFDLQGTRSYGRMISEINVNIAKTFRNNKGILAMGALAAVGSAILTRDSPDIPTDRQMRGANGGGLRAYNNVPNAIETNTQKAAYITPKNHTGTGKSVQVEGNYSSLLDMSAGGPYPEYAANMSNAVFGDGLRNARLDF